MAQIKRAENVAGSNNVNIPLILIITIIEFCLLYILKFICLNININSKGKN